MNLTPFLTKLLHQIRVNMGDGSLVSMDFCVLCEGRDDRVVTKGIHRNGKYVCECFCHDARALLTQEQHPMLVAETVDFDDALQQLQQPGRVELVKAPAHPIFPALLEVLQSEQGPEMEGLLNDIINDWRKASAISKSAKKGKRG